MYIKNERMMHIPTVKTKHETSNFIYSDARAAATKIKFLQNLLNLKQKQNGQKIFA